MSFRQAQVRLADVIAAPDKQPRTGLNRPNVQRMVSAIKAGIVLPPIVVCEDAGELVLFDGFHRAAAHRAAGLPVILADVFDDPRKATVETALRNANGLPWTTADAKRAAASALRAGIFEHEGRPDSFRSIAGIYAPHGLKLMALIRHLDKAAAAGDERLRDAVARVRAKDEGADVEALPPMTPRDAIERNRMRRMEALDTLDRQMAELLSKIPKADRVSACRRTRKYLK